MEENKSGQTNFKGWDLSNRPYELTSFECKECPNRCEIRKVTVEGEKPLFYGSRCEKYDVDRTRKRRDDIPDLFAEREEALMASYVEEKPVGKDARTIGIPRLLHFHEIMPFWKTFFTALGFRIVFSERTNKRLIHKGVERIVAETCFPIKVAHGHLLDLIDKGGRYHLSPQRDQHAPDPSFSGPFFYLPLRSGLPRLRQIGHRL